ncbi:MAG: SDR family oxidoreductase [Chloroflexota bacterium]|nr:SDR family oxidoreductase [Chloroflexota bacterium]
MANRVLVTGGCGYIGAVLVPMLLERGYQVRVFDKLYFGDDSLADVRNRIEMVAGDVRKLDPAVLDGIDAVIHLGSLSNDPTADFDPEATHSINYVGTITLARACRERGIGRFTFASTCAVYGFSLDELVDETFPANPQSHYAKSKRDVELELQSMADDGFCPVSLRQATVFGYSPRMRWDTVVNAFVMHSFRSDKLEVWYGGDVWRPMVHVRDTAEAHIRCLEAETDKVRGEIFNVVHGNYRILELAHHVRKALGNMGIEVGLDVNRDQVDTRNYKTSGDKMTRVLGFTPSTSIVDGVKEIAEVLRDGHCRDFDHPIYYNMRWMKLLVDIEDRLKRTGSIL